MNHALQCLNVTAGYLRAQPVLHDLTLCITTGEMVGLLGPNGAGKSTVLKLATGLLSPWTGAVRLFGQDLNALTAEQRARLVAVVPQGLDVPFPVTVQDLVALGRAAHIGRWARLAPADRHAIERALAYTDTTDLRRRFANEISGGEKQRVLIAMALAQEPRLLLMDEATSHLDINHRLDVMQLIERLNAEHNLTVLLISHDLHLAAEFCQRLILLEQGRVAADGPPRSVLTANLLRRVYRCEMHVQTDPLTGSLSIRSASRLPPPKSGRGTRVHVVAGGGCGEETLRRLALCSYTVTCGVLNQGDLDAEVAEALNIETAFETPFSPVGDKALQTAREMIRGADAVVLTAVPFGEGNLANLELLAEAQSLGKPVFVADGIASRDYTKGHRATALASALLSRGAVVWQTVSDLLAALPRDKASRQSAVDQTNQTGA